MATLVAGWHAVSARLKAGGLDEIWLVSGRRDRRVDELRKLALQASCPVHEREAALLNRAADGVRHQGVLGFYSGPPAAATLEECLAASNCPLVLVLDGVEDPRNLGACLRAADGAGADCVIVPRRRSAELNTAARKTAAGAADAVPLYSVTNLARSLDELKRAGLWIIGLADGATETLYEMDMRQPLALVLGNEGQGLRKLTAARCDALATLPMAGSVSSLNVAVATGVVLYEAVRQRAAA